MRYLFRHYRAWLRLKNRKRRGEEIAQEMENSWSITRVWRVSIYDNLGKKDETFRFRLTIVGKENLLGKRKIKDITVYPDDPFYVGSSNLNLFAHAERVIEAHDWAAGLSDGPSGVIPTENEP